MQCAVGKARVYRAGFGPVTATHQAVGGHDHAEGGAAVAHRFVAELGASRGKSTAWSINWRDPFLEKPYAAKKDWLKG